MHGVIGSLAGSLEANKSRGVDEEKEEGRRRRRKRRNRKRMRR